MRPRWFEKRFRLKRGFSHVVVAESLEKRCLLTTGSSNATAAPEPWFVVLYEEGDRNAAYQTFLENAEQALGREIEPRHTYRDTLFGLALELSVDEADRIESLTGVDYVRKSSLHQRQSLFGRDWIGADHLWNGPSTGNAIGTQGEGVVIGIVDGGIDPRNPSFAAVGPVDGYQHINPLGTNADGSPRYLGVCDPDDPQHDSTVACNSKVIGIYNFSSDDVDDPREDGDHGSHVAGIAAGNVVDVSLDSLAAPVRIAGVAPHANVIAYDVCFLDGCFVVDMIAGIDQAIQDKVDVINMSLGVISGFDSPEVLLLSNALQRAEAAGIFVAVAGGNEGPDPSTVWQPAPDPWLTAVANTSHDGLLSKSADLSATGTSTQLTGLQIVEGEGVAIVADIGPLPIRDAAEIDPANHEGCAAFAAGSFHGAVALIDRGTCFFVDKIANAENAGAIAVVIANNVSSPPFTMGGLDNDAIPAVMVSQPDGNEIRQYMAAHSNAEIVINSRLTLVQSVELADIVSFDSSRGPNPFLDVLSPSVAAPGTEILAAEASATNVPVWNFNSGTSMASPHVAGAAALVRSLQPIWTPSEIQSAFMTTAVPFHQLVKEDGVTAADPHDVGSGRIDLENAALAGFLLHETEDNFASKTTRATSRELNLPAFVHSELSGPVSWTRTIRSSLDRAVQWTPSFTGLSQLNVTVEPSVVTLGPGAVAEIVVTAQFTSPPTNPTAWQYGSLTFVPDDISVPSAHMPLAVQFQTDAIGFALSQHDVVEGSGPLTAQVFRNSDTTNAITVNLGSSDESQASLPASIVIPAGASESAEFTITIADDGVAEQLAAVTFTAAAAGHSDATAEIKITDDDAVDLVATAFNVISDHVPGGTAEVELTVRNAGQHDAGNFDVTFLWSPDDVFRDANDVFLTSQSQSPLAAGESRTQTLNIPLDKSSLYAHAVAHTPAGSPVGTVSTGSSFIFLVVDSANTVSEIDETNNSGQGHQIDSDDIAYFPWDSNQSGVVTPKNALSAIAAVGSDDFRHDADGNGVVTPLEALDVVQRIGVARNDSVSSDVALKPSTLELLIPLYQFPTFGNGNTELTHWWRRISEEATADQPITVVFNPQNGTADPENPASDFQVYRQAIRLLAVNPHVRIIGYVHSKDALTGQIRDIDDVKANVEFYNAYRSLDDMPLVDGIFVDEVFADAANAAWYRELATHIRQSPRVELRGNLIIGNPGVVPAAELLSPQIADVFVTFENVEDSLNVNDTDFRDAQPPAGSPSLQYAAIVHGVAGIANRDRGVSERNRLILEAKRKGFDYLYLTDDVLSNPFDDEPGFWNGMLNEIAQPFAPDLDVAGVQQSSVPNAGVQTGTELLAFAVSSHGRRNESLFERDEDLQRAAPVAYRETAVTDDVFANSVSWLDVVAPAAIV